MTNLVEKSLIIGFGIFILIVFFGIILPFFNEIEDIKKENEEKIDDTYSDFIKEVDIAISYVINNPDENVLDFIKYPEDLNITILNYTISFYYQIDGEVKYDVITYGSILSQRSFRDMASKVYLLNVRYEAGHILVDLSE